MLKPDYALFNVTATTLTPLHIGSGVELLNEYDYAVFNKQTWRINDAALLEAQNVDDPALASRLADIPPAQLLNDADFVPGSPYFRYVIRGTPRSTAAGAVLQEQIKDSFDRPYLPGSSLKGALRTALGWFAWGQKALKPEMAELGFRREWAAQNYEHAIFGPNPNKDAMRAIQVGDSAPLNAERMMIVNASVNNGSGNLGASIPVELEAIRPDTSFSLTLKLDLALYSDWAQRSGLHLAGLDWLLQLPAVLQRRARQRVEQEAEWFARQPEASRPLSFYRQLSATHLMPNQALIQMGWGTGWDGMTFGSNLRADPAFMSQLVTKFRLSRGKTAGGAFPKSRRTAVSFNVDPSGRRTTAPSVPLGWLLLTFEPVIDIPGDWKALVKPLATPAPARASAAPTPDPAAAAPTPKPTAAPAPVKDETPVKQPRPAIVTRFSSAPQPGDLFKGIVVESLPDGKITLEIPGIDADETGMALIPPENNPQRRRFADGKHVLCRVERIDTEKDGYYWAICDLED